jgi:hypothetical protein
LYLCNDNINLKTIYGRNSIGNRLEASKAQSDRVILNIISSIKARTVLLAIKDFFNNSKSAKEVLVYKKGKIISVSRIEINNNDYVNTFIREWNK